MAAFSPLLALQGAGASASEGTPPPPLNFNFDTSDLSLALLRSTQQQGAAGLRRAQSLPHSMALLGQEPPGAGGQPYLPPSGGPMRRVASSLGMRRSSSFFWTPSAHHDFERAVGSLASRGAEVSPASIMAEMGPVPELRLADVERHLKKKQLVHGRLRAQLSGGENRPPLQPASFGSGAAPIQLGGGAGLGAIPPFGGGPGFRMPASPGRGMAAVAEESPSQSASIDATVDAAAAADAAAIAAQFDAQRAQHAQFAQAREQFVAQVETSIVQQQQQQQGAS